MFLKSNLVNSLKWQSKFIKFGAADKFKFCILLFTHSRYCNPDKEFKLSECNNILLFKVKSGIQI